MANFAPQTLGVSNLFNANWTEITPTEPDTGNADGGTKFESC